MKIICFITHFRHRISPYFDTFISRSKSRSKESHKLETHCHARPENVLPVDRLGKGDIGRSEFRYANIVSRMLSTLSRKRNSIRICMCSGGIESKEEQGGKTTLRTHLRFRPYFPLLRHKVRAHKVCRRYLSLFARCIFATTRVRDTSIPRESACLPSRLCTHSRHCCIPDFAFPLQCCLFLDFVHKPFVKRILKTKFNVKIIRKNVI